MYYSGLPIFARSHTPYPLSMVELLVMCVFTALKSDEWNRTWLTDGNVPDEWMKLPPEMTADQAQSWLKLFNQMLSGNSRQRHKVKVTPGEITGRASRKDSDFQEFEFWMRDRTCSLMGVNPASIGHHSRQYKDSQGDAMDSTRENRVPALVGFRNDAYNDVCKRKGLDKIKATDQEPGEEDATARAERHKIEIESGQRTPNECRQDDGQEPYDGGDVHLVSSTLVPVTQLAAAPEAAPGTGPDDGSTPGADTAAGDAGQGGQASEENGDEETEAGNAEADSADGIFPAVARFVVARGTFEEAKHPRTHGKFASKGGAAPTTDKQPAVTKPAVAKQSRAPVPQLSEKAQRAKAAHHMVDKDIQRYAEDHNEPAFAKSLGGIAFKDNEPVDVVVPGPKGTLAHGIELKTVVSNKNAKITMKKSAMALKTDWEKRHKAPVHTVVLDDTAVFNANGPGQHDLSGRKVYYRRGFGSFRIGGMHPVENLKELKQLLDMPDDELPAAARPKRVKE
jgi:hypothetical protein